MYLDTDIILALLKEKDWLKEFVKIDKIENPQTSAFAVVEAEIILVREYERSDIFTIIEKLRKHGIKILDLNESVLEKSIGLMKEYPKLNIFDSVHAAFSVTYNEKMLSTDVIFDSISGIERIDPRIM